MIHYFLDWIIKYFSNRSCSSFIKYNDILTFIFELDTRIETSRILNESFWSFKKNSSNTCSHLCCHYRTSLTNLEPTTFSTMSASKSPTKNPNNGKELVYCLPKSHLAGMFTFYFFCKLVASYKAEAIQGRELQVVPNPWSNS